MVTFLQIDQFRVRHPALSGLQLIKQLAAVQGGNISVVLGNDDPCGHIHRRSLQRGDDGGGYGNQSLNAQNFCFFRHGQNIGAGPGMAHQDHPAEIAFPGEITGEYPLFPGNSPAKQLALLLHYLHGSVAAGRLAILKRVIDGHIHGDGQAPRIRQLIHQIGKAQVIAVFRGLLHRMRTVEKDHHRAVFPLRNANHALHPIRGIRPDRIIQGSLSQVIDIDVVRRSGRRHHGRIGCPVPCRSNALHMVKQLRRDKGRAVLNLHRLVLKYFFSVLRQRTGGRIHRVVFFCSVQLGGAAVSFPGYGVVPCLCDGPQGEQDFSILIQRRCPIHRQTIHQQLGGVAGQIRQHAEIGLISVSNRARQK